MRSARWQTLKSIICSLWWSLTWHFGLREIQKHDSTRVEDFSFLRDETGATHIVYAEGITKASQSSLLSEKSATVTKNAWNTIWKVSCKTLSKLSFKRSNWDGKVKTVLFATSWKSFNKHLVWIDVYGSQQYQFYDEKVYIKLTSSEQWKTPRKPFL